MHAEVVAALCCPHEGSGFVLAERTLRCERGHDFDLARQGYVNLVVGRQPGTGDDAAMVAAREEVLGAGRFAPITAELARLAAEHAPSQGAVVDLGAGTGHHLAGVLDRLPDHVGVALDLSKHAARRAARVHPRIGAVVADVWRGLPVRRDAAGVVLCVFAPRNADEIARVLRPDGVLVVVTPSPHHLGELVPQLGLIAVDPRKEERLLATLEPELVQRGEVRRLEVRWELDHAQVGALVAMGPSVGHLDTDEFARRLTALPEVVPVTAAVELRTFQVR